MEDREWRVPRNPRSIGVVVVLAIVALLSVTIFSTHFSSADTYAEVYQRLDEKRENVVALTASSAAISAGITLLPDDTGTPIAEELSEISKGFAIVIAALLFEKYLLTTFGFSFFAFVVPICCALLVASVFVRRGSPTRYSLRQSAIKLFAFGLVLVVSIPASVFISSKIDDTYGDSISAAIEESKDVSEAVEETSAANEEERAEGFLGFIQEQISNVQSAANSVVEDATGAMDWAEEQISNYVELFAVMIVTSIVIPIIVPVVIYIAFKILFGQQQIILSQAPYAWQPPELPEAKPGRHTRGE